LWQCPFKDDDGKLNLKEYVANVFGETDNAEDWDTGRLQFQQFRDKNKDGAIDKHELKVKLCMDVNLCNNVMREISFSKNQITLN
jgi:Ca2+-binding EF-hand superfamily protein